MDSNYRVVEAGFCVSNWDGTQSARSLVNVLDDYVDGGDYIHKTRTVKQKKWRYIVEKEEIINCFKDEFDKSCNIQRFKVVELKEGSFGVFNKRDYSAYILPSSGRTDELDQGYQLLCPYIGSLEDVNKDMFESFFNVVLGLKNPTLCLFFTKCNGTYKCGCFALEENKTLRKQYEDEMIVRKLRDENGLYFPLL